MKKRNHYSPEFKSKVVIEVLQEASTVNEIAAKYGISPVVISRWKSEFMERAAEVFKKGSSAAEKELEQKNERVAQLERKVVLASTASRLIRSLSRMRTYLPCAESMRYILPTPLGAIAPSPEY